MTAAGLVFNDAPTCRRAAAKDFKEAFTELDVPLFKDVAFAHALDFSVAARRSDYSNFGSTTHPKGSVHWQPVEDPRQLGRWFPYAIDQPLPIPAKSPAFSV